MAVPFSRPQFEGLPSPPPRVRRRPANRRPRSSLSGDRLDLRGLSFTARIAFYALYEAYRLLSDLSGEQTPVRETTETASEEEEEETTLDFCLNISSPPDVLVGSTLNSRVLPDLVPTSENVEEEDFKKPKESAWHSVGRELVRVAEEFDLAFFKPAAAENSSSGQWRLYRTYRDVRLRFLREESNRSFGRTLCSQLLLSSIWLLVKRAAV